MSISYVSDWTQKFPSFAPTEILSPQTLKYPHLMDIPFWTRVQDFRDKLGHPIIINTHEHQHRGVRSPDEQAEIERIYGGAKFSMHVQGKAADISCPAISTEALFREARAYGFHGIGLYPTFVHVDDRTLFSPIPAIWRKT